MRGLLGEVQRPLIAACVTFLAGALGGTLAILPCGLVAAGALLRRRPVLVAMALFGLAGGLAQETSTRAGALLERGTWILEGDLLAQDGDRAELELAGAAPVGEPIARARGRVVAFGSAEPCERGDRARVLATVRTVTPFGFPGERAAPPYNLAAIQRCMPISSSTKLLPIDRLRRRMRGAVDRALPIERAAVVRAMAIGDRIAGQPALRRDFADSGLSHVLAVSGQHLTIVSAFFTVLLAKMFSRVAPIRDRHGTRRPAALVAIGFVAAYTLLVGAPPSAVRAAIMVGIMLAGDLIGRRREAWSALSLAAVLMVALEPKIFGSLSFQLSFAAVAGLLLLDRPLRIRLGVARWPRFLRGIGSVIVTSLAATLGTAPLLAHHFGRISVIGLLANVPAAPLVTIFLLPISLLGSLAGAICEPIGAPLLWAAGWGAEALIRLAEVSASIPGATRAVSALETLLLGGALLSWVLLDRRRVALALAGALVAVAVAERWPAPPSEELVVTALPVGQGTAVLVETPEGARILVDTGPPDTAERVLVPYLTHRLIDRIDLVVLSHPHADHTGGFELLARRARIDRVWTNGDLRDAPADLTGHAARTVTATVAHLGGIRIEVLHARPDAARVNDGSIVLRLAHGRRRILLAGDAEQAAEADLVSSGLDLSADVLVVGHHGSKTSSSQALVDAVRPSFAIIPVGRDNTFRHPHQSVVARLERAGARVLRTDRNGAVTIRTDGETISASVFLDGQSR